VKSDEHCDRIIRTTATSIRLGYLSPATQYKVKVLARNDAGSGHYSEEYFQITNAGKISIRDNPYWTSRENSLEMIELFSVNKVSLV
jgi:hypothetical protein